MPLCLWGDDLCVRHQIGPRLIGCALALPASFTFCLGSFLALVVAGFQALIDPGGGAGLTIGRFQCAYVLVTKGLVEQRAGTGPICTASRPPLRPAAHSGPAQVTFRRRHSLASQAPREFGPMLQVPGVSASSRTTKSRNARVLRASRRWPIWTAWISSCGPQTCGKTCSSRPASRSACTI